MNDHDRIEKLHSEYLSLRENTPMMKRNGEECKAYHKWYDSAYVFFKSFEYLKNDQDFQTFVNAEKKGNCFELEHIYDAIVPSYKVLMNKIETMPQTVAEESASKTPLVFISHSSEDKDLIQRFIENVLVLGLGLHTDDIAFTSHEVYGVEPGDSIIRYIKNKITAASVVLIMISHHYKKSEVCLNEMGAAWAHGHNCLSVILPDADFKNLGWLSSFEKAERIVDKNQLLSLCSKIANVLEIDLNKRFTSAASYIDKFIAHLGDSSFKTIENQNVSPIIEGNVDAEIKKAINQLGVFSYDELLEKTKVEPSYLLRRIKVLVKMGELEVYGPVANRKYRVVV